MSRYRETGRIFVSEKTRAVRRPWQGGFATAPRSAAVVTDEDDDVRSHLPVGLGNPPRSGLEARECTEMRRSRPAAMVDSRCGA